MNSWMIHFFNWLLSPIPFARIMKFKVWYLRKAGVVIGENVDIQPNVRIVGVGQLVIGDNTSIRHGVIFECGTRIKIGNNCELNYGTLLSANCGAELFIENDVHIAHYVSIKCSTHKIDLTGVSVAGESEFKNIHIGEGSWLCAGSIILPGVNIGKRNVVAAGAVVVSDTEDDVLMAGVPAQKKKKYRD